MIGIFNILHYATPLNSTQEDEVIASFATEALLLQHWRLYKMRIEVLHTPKNGGKKLKVYCNIYKWFLDIG